jgi:hypothetical protein
MWAVLEVEVAVALVALVAVVAVLEAEGKKHYLPPKNCLSSNS